MKRTKSGTVRFWSKVTSRAGNPVTGVVSAAPGLQGGTVELAEEASETQKVQYPIPRVRASGAQSGSSPHLRPWFMEGLQNFCNLARDSLDNICPWKNEFLGIFTSPINIPRKRKELSGHDYHGGMWENPVRRPNSSLLSPKRRHVAGVQNFANEPLEDVDAWMERGNGVDPSPDYQHHFHRVERSYNFAVDFPEYYNAMDRSGRRFRCDEEDIEEPQTYGYERDDQDDELIFRMSL